LTHALLRGSRIFPGLELCDKPPEYTPDGLTDIWKGEYHGEPVCVKVVRGRFLSDLRETERVRRSFHSSGGCTQSASFQKYRRVVEESKLNSHPNVLPVVLVSKGPFPVCIMSPWMPDGNITRYTQTNPGADRLILVRVHWPELMGQFADYTSNSLHKCAAASRTFMGWVFCTVASIR